MAGAFDKQILRSIRESLGRFLAILLIVALGCGFYAGLRMTGPDMRLAADEWYDGTRLFDLELISTLGLTQRQVDLVSQVEGVEAVMPSRSVDAMTTLNDSQYVMRISTIDPQQAAGSTVLAANQVESPDGSYLNRLVLDRGEWPTQPGEAVLSADRVMNTSLDVGDTVTVEYGAADLDGVLTTRTYRVVGLVHSSLYTSDANMGTTSLGSGTIQQYMYVAPSNFDADYPYSELYLRVRGTSDLLSGSDAYQQAVDQVRPQVEAAAQDMAADRLAQLKEDAQKELDDARAEFEDAEREANEQLADAKSKLDDAQATLDSSQAELDSAWAQIADGQRQISDARDQLASGQSQADQAAADWKKQRADLEALIAQAQEGKATAQQALATAQQKQQELQAARETAMAGRAQAQEQYDAGIAQLEQQIAQLEPHRDDPEVAAQLELLRAQLATLQQERAAALQEIDQQVAAIDAGLAQVEAGIAQAQEGIAQADAGIAQAQAGILQGDAAIADAQQQLDSGKAELAKQESTLESARAQANSGAAQLESGRAEYQSGLEEYEQKRADAQRELDDARADIDQAQADIDALEAPEVFVLDRTKNFGVQSVQADSERIDNIASVFPFVFFLVAALVALTTMTRMIDEERQLIGTFKALGYRKARITGKYLLYAGIASAAGALLGIALLGQVLPSIIANAYGIIYNVPQPTGMRPYDVPIAAQAGLLGVGITLAATWAAAANSLRETPAALMLPPAPAPGKRILLERLGFVWRRLSFSWKVTFRNLFRYKKRFWMTVVGLAGCTALLLTGFGLHNAIWDIIDKQYGPILQYNVAVTMDEDATDENLEAVAACLRDEGRSDVIARTHAMNIQVGTGGVADKTWGVVAVVPQDPQDLTRVVNLKQRETQQPIAFDDNSVVVTEKLARTAGVDVGDTLMVFDQDSVGNATGSGRPITVTGVAEYYVGDRIYMGKNVCANWEDVDLRWDTLYAGTATDVREQLNKHLMESAGVQTVAFNDETIETYRTMLQSVNIIVVVLVLAAALLSFIVLYNLININITERRREIASLKVLGFTPGEVNAYIFREVLLLTLIGAALGLVLGVFLEGFVVVTAEVDYVMFGRDIHAWSFVLAFVLTIVFTCVVMLFMRGKLAVIDMVESLKSVE